MVCRDALPSRSIADIWLWGAATAWLPPVVASCSRLLLEAADMVGQPFVVWGPCRISHQTVKLDVGMSAVVSESPERHKNARHKASGRCTGQTASQANAASDSDHTIAGLWQAYGPTNLRTYIHGSTQARAKAKEWGRKATQSPLLEQTTRTELLVLLDGRSELWRAR